MGKINNEELYPKLTSGTISSLDFVPGTQYSTGFTKNFPIGLIAALAEGANNRIEDEVVEALTYQNDELIDKTGVWLWFQGSEMETGELLAENSYDSETGTITFNTKYAPFTGKIKLLYFL